MANQARDQTHKVDAKLEEYRANASKSMDETMNKTGKELNKAVDSFDKNVSEVNNSLPRVLDGIEANRRRARARRRAVSPAGSAGSKHYMNIDSFVPV